MDPYKVAQLRDQLEAIKAAGYTPLKTRIYKGELITYISSDEMWAMVDIWCNSHQQPYGFFICKDPEEGWSVCEGETGECYCEDFHYERYALRWLVPEKNDDTDAIHELDQIRYFKVHGADWKNLVALWDQAVYRGEVTPETVNPWDLNRRFIEEDRKKIREGPA